MKAELLENLNTNRDQLLGAVAGLTEEQMTTLPVVGEWTIKDLVGHIAYWEGVILDHVRESYTEGRPRPMRDDENDDIVNPR
ncbi:MAG: DinB family protein, partial [Acidobacteriota bacterium]